MHLFSYYSYNFLNSVKQIGNMFRYYAQYQHKLNKIPKCFCCHHYKYNFDRTIAVVIFKTPKIQIPFVAFVCFIEYFYNRRLFVVMSETGQTMAGLHLIVSICHKTDRSVMLRDSVFNCVQLQQ